MPLAECGLIFVQFPGDAVYLPPGTLHAVYTLNGGCLVGAGWITESSLIPCTHLLLQELGSPARKPHAGPVYINLLCSLRCAIRAGATQDIQAMMAMLCDADRNELQSVHDSERPVSDTRLRNVSDDLRRGERADISLECTCGRSPLQHLPKRRYQRKAYEREVI